jgi:hypothetical protein
LPCLTRTQRLGEDFLDQGAMVFLRPRRVMTGMLRHRWRNRKTGNAKGKKRQRSDRSGPAQKAEAKLSGHRNIPRHDGAQETAQHLFSPASLISPLTINISIDYQHMC